MRQYVLLLYDLLLTGLVSTAQTGVGIALYPTGTESGFGLRSGKDKRVYIDARIARATFFSDSKAGQSNFLTELSVVYKAIKLEKVRFQVGIGFRGDWNLVATHKYGAVLPIGVEAFPFPFQNAGLIFEVAPYCVSDVSSNLTGGIRTVAGFIFYFPRKPKTKG